MSRCDISQYDIYRTFTKQICIVIFIKQNCIVNNHIKQKCLVTYVFQRIIKTKHKCLVTAVNVHFYYKMHLEISVQQSEGIGLHLQFVHIFAVPV